MNWYRMQSSSKITQEKRT